MVVVIIHLSKMELCAIESRQREFGQDEVFC